MMSYYESADAVPIGPRLLGEILRTGLVGANAAPLIASAIELDSYCAQALPQLWKDANEDVTGSIFALETAWNELRSAWLTARDVIERIVAATNEVKRQSAEMSRPELAEKIRAADAAQGGPEMRDRLLDKLRLLVEAHTELPMIHICERCGRPMAVPGAGG